MRLPPAIGRYRTKGLLGTGTFATVVLAEDDALETAVAIKVLAENWSLDPDVRARFVREARMLRRIDSPRLIRVHDIGEFDQRPYFVMDFAPGGTLGEGLSALRERGGLPLAHETSLTVARELASCIGAAHSFGLVHRDVKPSNLLIRPTHTPRRTADDPAEQPPLLAPDEELVLADFGLARDVKAGSALSVGAGTHGYMAPEQSDPAVAVDERTDVYACTVILMSALTGALPAVIADADRRAALLDDLDPSIARVLERGLAGDRDRRPSSAGEWLEEIESAFGRNAGGSPPSRARQGGLPRWLAELRRSPMVGREATRERFRGAWDRVRAGGRSAVLFTGEAGIGKSRLLAELGAEVAREGGVVLAGRGDDSVRLPYGALVHALRPALREDSVERVLAEVGSDAGHLALVLPDLAPRVAAPAPGDPDSNRALLLAAVDALLAVLGGAAPLVLVVDDLHAVDPSTLGVLRYLVRSDRQEPLLLLGAYRSTEVAGDHPLLAVYDDLHRHHLVMRTELRGLAEPELAELVTQRDGTRPSPVVLRALRHQTAGNPFFVEEILSNIAEQDLDLAGGVERVPEGARDVVRSRLSRLSDGARDVLLTAAVVGHTFERQVIERVVDPASLEGLDEAISGGFIEPSEQILSFRHDLVRGALLHGLGHRQAATLHWRVGEALERIHAANVDGHVAEIAHHLSRGVTAGDAAKASEFLERSGLQQFRALALDEAVASLSAALDLAPDGGEHEDRRRLGILEMLAETHFWRADPDAMRAAALAAAEVARRYGSAESLARMATVASRWNRAGELDRGLLALVDEAASLLPPGDSGMRSQLLAMRAYMLQGAARGFDARTPAQEAEAMARRCDDVEALTLALLVQTYTEAGAPTIARTRHVVTELEEAAAQFGREDHRQQYTVFALRARAHVQLVAGDRVLFSAARSEMGEVAERMRAAYWRSQVLQWDAAIALAEGRFGAADELADAALETWNARPDAYRYHFVQKAAAGLERGEHERLLPEIERQVAGDASSIRYAWRAVLACGLAAAHRPEESRRWLEDLAGAGFRGLADDFHRPFSLRWLAEVVALLRAPDLAASLLPLVEPYAGLLLVGPALSTVECAADRAMGQLLATLGRHDEAERHYERAAALEARLGFAALEARTRRWWAKAVDERGGPGDAERARALAQDAAQRAERLGMGLLAASARELAAPSA
ncbi:MAG: serine/threonine-protein kinase PknK, partial [Acidimicrobiia bacterium]